MSLRISPIRFLSNVALCVMKKDVTCQVAKRFFASSMSHQSITAVKPIYSEKDLYSVGVSSAILQSAVDLVRYLQDPTLFSKQGIAAPQGVILSGPPGVGKTHMAEAIAGHAGVPLYLVKAPEMERSLIGASEAQLRSVFTDAEKTAPSLLCIDEIDSIGAKRRYDSPNSHYINSMVNQLLTLLGKPRPGMVVMATTNHYEALDPALVRPGRFDRHIVLSLPNIFDRHHILKILTEHKNLAPHVSLKKLAEISEGFSGAKLATWVNEAAILSLREKGAEIKAAHFDSARDTLLGGVLSENRRTREENCLIAIHETGHALVGYLLGSHVYKITIQQRNHFEGCTEFSNKEQLIPSKQDFLNNICMTLGGRAAEQLAGVSTAGCHRDFQIAKEMARKMVQEYGMGSTLLGNSCDVESILQQELLRAMTLLKENKELANRITAALIHNETLSKEQFLAAIQGKPIKKEKIFHQMSTKQKVLLPPKISHAIRLVQSEPEISSSLPFTIDEIAHVFEIEPGCIRKMYSSNGGYVIKFKPSFNQHDHMHEISDDLKKKDVENNYFANGLELNIHADGTSDFLKYLKKQKA